MPAEVESMVSVRELPWHGLGTVVQEQLTAQAALEQSGLDWEVDKRPVFVSVRDGVNDAPHFEAIPDRYATTRSTDGAVFGIVGSAYTVLQNRDAFAFADSLVDDGSAKYETAGSLKGGRRVWMMMTLPEGITVAGDEVDLYLALTNSHDGKSAVTAMVTPVRVVCQNTLNLAISKAQRSWSVRHVGTLDGRLEEARRALELSFKYIDEFSKTAEELADQSWSTGLHEIMVEKLTENETYREGLMQNYEESETLGDIRFTKWGAVNSVGEYFDWGRSQRTDEARFKNTVGGVGTRMRDKALTLLTA